MDFFEKQKLMKKLYADEPLLKAVRLCKQLKVNGLSDDEVMAVIVKADFPLGLHMQLTGRFSQWMEMV